jgi:hypothetical protein
MQHASSRLGFQRLLAVALTLVLLAATLPAAAAAQATPPLDITAILLTPADLDAENLSGYGVDSGKLFTTIDGAIAVDDYADSRGSTSLRDVTNIAQILQGAGWERMQETLLARPFADDPAHFDASASSGIEVYATPEGAARAYQQLAAKGPISQMLIGDVQPAGTGEPMGDQASTWRNAQAAADNDGLGSISISRWVQVDRYIVSVTLVDFGHGDTATDPDPVQLDRLTNVVLDRLASATTMGSGTCGRGGPTGADPDMTRLLGRVRAVPATLALPGLSTCVLHLDEAGTMAFYSQYRVLGGTAIPSRGESATDFAERQADASQRGIVASFIEEQGIAGSALAPTGTEADVITFLDLYTDNAAATASLAGTQDRAAARSIDIVSFETGTLPDGTPVIRYVFPDSIDGAYVVTTAAVVDNLVVTARVGNITAQRTDLTDALLTSQLACIAAGGCPQPIPAPPDLLPH